MAATAKITVTNMFADDTTSKITIDNLRPENVTSTEHLAAMKAQVEQFNDQKGGTLSTKMKSKNGANWIGIKAVQITTTDRTYIF